MNTRTPQQIRAVFLHRLYEESKANTQTALDIKNIVEPLGLTEDEIDSCLQYALKTRWIEPQFTWKRGHGFRVALTPKGIRKAENQGQGKPAYLTIQGVDPAVGKLMNKALASGGILGKSKYPSAVELQPGNATVIGTGWTKLGDQPEAPVRHGEPTYDSPWLVFPPKATNRNVLVTGSQHPQTAMALWPTFIKERGGVVVVRNEEERAMVQRMIKESAGKGRVFEIWSTNTDGYGDTYPLAPWAWADAYSVSKTVAGLLRGGKAELLDKAIEIGIHAGQKDFSLSWLKKHLEALRAEVKSKKTATENWSLKQHDATHPLPEGLSWGALEVDLASETRFNTLMENINNTEKTLALFAGRGGNGKSPQEIVRGGGWVVLDLDSRLEADALLELLVSGVKMEKCSILASNMEGWRLVRITTDSARGGGVMTICASLNFGQLDSFPDREETYQAMLINSLGHLIFAGSPGIFRSGVLAKFMGAYLPPSWYTVTTLMALDDDQAFVFSKESLEGRIVNTRKGKEG